MRNKYIKVTHISEQKKREIIRLFSLDIEAESPFTNGEVELDESYFGARRVCGIRGCGARDKMPVFGMLKRGDRVYNQNRSELFYGRIIADNKRKNRYLNLLSIPMDLGIMMGLLITAIRDITE